MIGTDTMYRLLVQGVVDYAIYMLDPSGIVLNWNAGAERAKGYRAEDIIGRNFALFYTEEDRAAGLPEAVLATARSTGRFESEGWRLRRGGDRFWAHVVVDAIHDEGGQFVGFAKVTRDLTERRRREEEVQRIRQRLDLALAHMSQGLIMFDAAEQLVFCNERLQTFLHVEPRLTQPGTSFTKLVQDLVGGEEPDSGAGIIAHNIREQLVARLLEGKGTVSEEFLHKGSTLLLSHQPLPGGGWVTTVDDITERRRIEEQIVYLAQHDALTDLPNRTAIHRAFRQAAEAGKSLFPCALLYIDLDRFKPVNDTFGHKAGDQVLRHVAQTIRDQLRHGDVPVRLGGDEFVVVARDCATAEAALVLAGRLIQTLGRPIALEQGLVTIGASIGVAIAPPDGLDPDTLLQHADFALYRAKQQGRNRAALYDPAMEAGVQERRQFERELRQAFAERSFALRYQPFVDARSGRVKGFEALLRWDSPSLGAVPVARFIPFAEEIGLMRDIDDWVLRQACAEAANWPDDLVIAVNLSPASFRREKLVETVRTTLEQSKLPSRRLELEVTETATIDNLEAAGASLRALRELGVQVALDDFGTGYSSLSLVRTLSFTRIKIDRSFVADMADDPQAAAVVRAICGLCKSLGVRSTAEGVETADRAELLRTEGCTDLQGYLFSEPLQAGDIQEWLALAEDVRQSEQDVAA